MRTGEVQCRWLLCYEQGKENKMGVDDFDIQIIDKNEAWPKLRPKVHGTKPPAIKAH